jgi:hypothetical protein
MYLYRPTYSTQSSKDIRCYRNVHSLQIVMHGKAR